MDSDLAWVNGKSGRQSWRYADAFQRSIISEAIYHYDYLFTTNKEPTRSQAVARIADRTAATASQQQSIAIVAK